MNNEYDHYYQEQQSSQPSYNNNYGYSDNKKISFNNSYDKDNSKYSTQWRNTSANCNRTDVIFECGYKERSFAAEPDDIVNTIDRPSFASPSTYQAQLTSNVED